MKTFKSYLPLTCVALLLLPFFFESCYPEPGEVNQTKLDSRYVFTLCDNFLYAVGNDEILSFKLDNGVISPAVSQLSTRQVEALYSSSNTLVVLSDGANIYNITSDGKPDLVSNYFELALCDNVAVKDQYIFSSKRINSDCQNYGFDMLEIVNASTNPGVITSQAVDTPYGLSIDDDVLFLCQGSNGFSIYNIQDPSAISLIKHYDNIFGKSVNAADELLLITNDDGIAQYDYSDLNNLKLLSKIPILK